MISQGDWASRIEPQPMFDILSKANQREAEGHYVARMEIGDTPGFYNSTIHELLNKYSIEPMRYSPSNGEPSLIDAVFEAEWPQYADCQYEVSIAPANFLITAALAAITAPGDLVLIPDPGFPTYKLACNFLGLQTESYSLYPNPKSSFPSFDEYNHGAKKPKAIIVNNPSNPMGIAFDGDQVLKAIAPLIHSGVKVILDETYVNLVYDGTNSIIDFPDAIRIRTFSKQHCAPGLRIGYALAIREYSKTISNFISLTISCAPKFLQLAVAEYLQSDSSYLFQEHIHKVMRYRFSELARILPKDALLTRPNAAFYSLIHTGDAENSFNFFLHNNVATCPGSRFGNSSKESLRVSIAGKSENFERDLNLLKMAQEAWSNKESD